MSIMSTLIAVALMMNPIEFAMKIESPAFANGQTIPAKYTCQGENVSPALEFSGVPKNTRTLALVMDDPDAPRGTFDHWIAWNIPADSKGLSEGVSLPHQGKNHYQVEIYKGPCPPPGKPHHYFFKLYALDTEISLPNGSTKEALEAAMEGHVLVKAELVGLFQR